MTTSTPEKQDGLQALNDAMDVVKEKIEELGGVFQIQMAVSIFLFIFYLSLTESSNFSEKFPFHHPR